MKRAAQSTVVAAVIGVLTGCAGTGARPPAIDSSGNDGQHTVQAFAGTWHGLVTGREMFGLAQRATLVVQPDGRWTLNAGPNREEGTISRVAGDVLELEGRFVPDGAPAGVRLQRTGDALMGSATTRFPLTGVTINTGIQLERERGDSIQASPVQPTATASPFEGREGLQSAP